MSWRVIPYIAGDPAWNMAVDEAIFCAYVQKLVPPTIRFYGWTVPTISVGFFQDIQSEINVTNISRKRYGLVRRNTGGRAVLHDHELTYSVVASADDGVPDNLTESYLYISNAFVKAFHHFGVSAELHQGSLVKKKGTGACFESPSWYELTVKGRKLVGSAQFRQKGAFLQHGSILLEFAPENLASVLSFDDLSTNERVEKLREKVTSFADVGVHIEPADLAAEILNSFQTLYHITFTESPLTEIEIDQANQFVQSKYANDDWNLSRGDSNKRMIRNVTI